MKALRNAADTKRNATNYAAQKYKKAKTRWFL